MKQKTNIPQESFSPANHARYLLHGIWESEKVLMALMLLEMVCTVVTPFAALYLPKAGVDLVTNQADTQQAALTLAGLTAVLLVSQSLGSMAARGKTRRLDRVRSYFRNRLFCKTLECDYEHAESAEWQDKYEQARLMSVNWGLSRSRSTEITNKSELCSTIQIQRKAARLPCRMGLCNKRSKCNFNAVFFLHLMVQLSSIVFVSLPA